jgi:parallel beta-helix repeat protein
MRSGMFSKMVVVILFACAAATAAEPGRIIYVDAAATGAKTGASWADACNCLQDALAVAKAATKPIEIRVAKGIHKPDQGAGITPGDQAATFQLLNGVTLKGGYAGAAGPDPDVRDVGLYETMLSGDLAGNDGTTDATRKDNSGNVVTGSGTDRTAVIDGFTITAGNSWPNSYKGASASGGSGMLIDAGSPTILNCRFTANVNWAWGAALLVRNAASPLVADCIFLKNTGTGISNSHGSNSVLINCRFEGNTEYGVDTHSSDPTITSCLFTGNGGYAIRGSDSNSVLIDCVFQASGTVKSERGIFGTTSNLTLIGCTFTGLGGAGVEVMSGDLNLSGCTFTGLHRECVHVMGGGRESLPLHV